MTPQSPRFRPSTKKAPPGYRAVTLDVTTESASIQAKFHFQRRCDAVVVRVMVVNRRSLEGDVRAKRRFAGDVVGKDSVGGLLG